jgi:hypothetical protein
LKLINFTREVIAQLEVMFNQEEDDEPDRTQGHDRDMSVIDKMRMWTSKAGQDHSVHSKEELFEGVKDEEEDAIDQSELSAYHNIIVDSPAYQWLLTNLSNEFLLQSWTTEPRIRQRILDKLPTGTISKQRSPDIHEFTFELELNNAMQESILNGFPQHRRLSNRSFRSFFVLTGSPWEAQGLTVEQYLAQTWPITGLQLIDALEKATTNLARHSLGKSETPDNFPYHTYSYLVSLPEKTQLEIRILPSHLVVTATGPAYFVADCGESLSWLGSAVCSKTSNIRSYCLPLITSFRIDSVPLNSTLMKYKGYCKLGFELKELGTSDESVPGVQNFSRDLLDENALVLGFPIRRRPEGYPGLELSFDTLLHYLQAKKAEIFLCDVFIKGPNRVLKLIKHIDDIFLWQLDHSLADNSLCCPDERSRAIAIQDYSFLDHHTLEVGRHILSKCADDVAPAKGTYQVVLT